ncbi:MAG: hypothetical protein HY660_09170 [Armatimonadetes bacterium]|nr:hypothetical protein [Armatimonadota bacterium]
MNQSTGVRCAFHPDAPALTYCSRCGKALCKSCVVRLSSGNYCARCAEQPEAGPAPARPSFMRWVLVGVVLLVLSFLFRALFR